MNPPNIPYSHDDLYGMGPQRTFTGKHLDQIKFPLGGIGTGTISLGGRGELRDWEIFNRPGKDNRLQFAFFTLCARSAGGSPVLKVLQSPPLPPFNPNGKESGFGVPRDTGAGLPHMRSAAFTGSYPFAHIDFEDSDMPVDVSLEAWNPTIPHNADDSGIPTAIFYWTLTNPSEKDVEIVLVGNLPTEAVPGAGEIRIHRDKGLTVLQAEWNADKSNDPNFGTIALSTNWPNTTWQTAWQHSEDWFFALWNWADCMKTNGRLSDSDAPASGKSDVGSLGMTATIKPGQSVRLPMFISWCFPIFEKYWHECNVECQCEKPRWRNYYASQFSDARSAAKYTADNLSRLETETRLFHDSLFDSTLPSVVLDAISSQASIIKTTTCIRLPDGTFYGWEGCGADAGSCEGSCTHVWNYAQTHAFLYPELERSMRDAEYKYSMHPDGKVCFRLQLPLGTPPNDFYACADGQMGAIMQVYRDWQLGGGGDWLKNIWPYVKRSLEYAWLEWDTDRDGIMEGVQHNTYDTELHGPNAMCGVMYLGALRAAALMADHLGESDFALECRRIEESGSCELDAQLFNGEYYIQPYDPDSGLKYQVGPGCLIDQLIGQQLAHVYGLGYLLPQEHVLSTVKSVYRYNFKLDFWNHLNSARVFALNDESGTVICTWPHGGRPYNPTPYADEVMIGFEYQLASHLIYEGMIDEGLAVTKAVRDRHDGERRNPWNEIEWGNHYARSMANWAIKLALDGFSFNCSEGRIGFAPAINNENFRTFWSTATAWGTYEQQPSEGRYTLNVAYGVQSLQTLELADLPDGACVDVEGPSGRLAARTDGKSIILDGMITIPAGSSLCIHHRPV